MTYEEGLETLINNIKPGDIITLDCKNCFKVTFTAYVKGKLVSVDLNDRPVEVEDLKVNVCWLHKPSNNNGFDLFIDLEPLKI